jgi:hypothetical protein
MLTTAFEGKQPSVVCQKERNPSAEAGGFAFGIVSPSDQEGFESMTSGHWLGREGAQPLPKHFFTRFLIVRVVARRNAFAALGMLFPGVLSRNISGCTRSIDFKSATAVRSAHAG